jgi:gliding motility-associated-like protein
MCFIMKRILLFLVIFINYSNGFSQAITVNTTTYTVPQLVQDVLFGLSGSGSCAGTISNITWSTGANFGSSNGIGYFENSNPSFPLSNGVILSTGLATNASGPNNGILSDGATVTGTWSGDPQLFNYIQGLGIDAGLTSYNNTTKLEFDFVPLTNSMSFNFLFASEEYGTFQCDFSDAFAFFLTDVTAGTAPVNLALIPGTTTPISVVTIRDDANNNGCISANPNYFGLFNGGVNAAASATNFNGQTVSMTANSTVVPNNIYHIKLVIAERNDGSYDSAVFLQGGSFNIGQADITGTGFLNGVHDFTVANGNALCNGSPGTIQASATPIAGATYSWSLNNVTIPGENGYILNFTQPGVYGVTISLASGCQLNDSINVEYQPAISIGSPNNMSICNNSPDGFNLSLNTPVILNGLNPNDYLVAYYANQNDADNLNEIPNTTTYTGTNGQVIYATVTSILQACVIPTQFTLGFVPCGPVPTEPADLTLCENAFNSGTATFDLTQQNATILGTYSAANYTVSYHTSLADAQNDINPIVPANAYANISNPQTIFVRMEENAASINYGTTDFQLIVNVLPTVSISAQATAVCPGDSTNIIFNGTPNTIVTYNIDGIGSLTVNLNGTGTASVPTAGLVAATTYNLVSVSTNTGVPICSQNQNGSVTVSLTTPPVINTPTSLQVCDDNNDGFSTFMLTTKDNEITGGQANLVVTYHETATNAQTGANPIASPYLNIVAGIQIVHIRVFDAASPQCASVTTMQLIVNPRPIPNPIIADYELCDSNNPGDGIENFDLPTKSAEILNGQTGSNVTYYETQLDAQNETNPINAAVLYPNTGTPQQIWIRLENNTTGCFSVSSFNLVVNPLPTVVAPNPMNGCSNGASNTTQFNLSLNDNTISGGVPNVTVSYYLTLAEAQNEVNALAIPYSNISNPQTVFVRVENNSTGCYDTTTLVLNVTQGPTANTPAALEVCDPNSDGFTAFNLENASNEISGGSVPAGVIITYHETPTDAQNGTNALVSPYTNIVAYNQPIYVNVSYALTGCSNFVTLQLIVHNTPEATEIAPLEVCDDNADGVASFDLTSATAGILGGLDPALHTVTYYAQQADAQLGTNSISNVLSYVNVTANTQIIWVRVEHNITGCFDVVQLGLTVNPLPIAPFPVPSYSLCDYNNPGDEKEQFDLNTKIPQIIGAQTGLAVTFHFSAADATAGINTLPNLYTNTSNAQTLHVRVENTTTHCFVTSTMDLRVEPLPSPVQPASALAECDADGDGFSNFDLDSLIPAMLNGAPDTIITFHETLQEANDGNNDLVSPYTSIDPFVQFIYVRAENTVTGCYSVIMIELNANPSPVIPVSTVLQDLRKCDEDNNNQNGFTTFNLTVQTPILLAAQSGSATNYSVSFYTSLANAQAGINPIITPNNFTNTTNAQTIWVSVKNNGTGCSSIGSFQLIVETPLALVTPAQLSLCDDGPTSAIPTRAFNLTVKDNEILGLAVGYTVTYFPSNAEALAGVNAIANPATYTNTANPQTLGVMVTSAAGCRSYTTLTIRVLPLPTPKTDPQELVKCDDVSLASGVLGTELFDLTVNENYIRNNDPALTFEYYPTQADADAQTNMIVNPTAYEVGTGIIWIRVMNNQVNSLGSNCYVLVQQAIKVNLLPVVTNQIYTICDTTSPATYIATFTLSSMNDELLGTSQNVTDFTVSYYLTAADAQTGTNPLPDSYVNIPDPITHEQNVYVRVVNNLTGCVSFTGVLTLKVEEAATISQTPTPLKTCDNDGTNDGFHLFDLTTTVQPEVLGATPNPNFAVLYYYTLLGATNNDPADVIPNPSAYVNQVADNDTVWVVVTNTATTSPCRVMTSVAVTVEQLAEPVITTSTGSNTICVEWGTNALLSGLTLNCNFANVNPAINLSDYTFQWSLNGQVIPGATNSTYVINGAFPGDYTVVATSINPPLQGCVSNPSQVFTVIQSGPAMAINAGYTVSNAFSDNQVITVTVQGYGVYHYQLDNGPILDNGGIFENVSSGPHTVYVHDVRGNTSCDLLQMDNIQTISYPHYFTPNGDGINDYWKINGLTQAEAKIYIFDRFGKLIKQISSLSPGWDGTFNGQPLPSTDYWFTVDFLETGANRVFKAHFSMKR